MLTPLVILSECREAGHSFLLPQERNNWNRNRNRQVAKIIFWCVWNAGPAHQPFFFSFTNFFCTLFCLLLSTLVSGHLLTDDLTTRRPKKRDPEERRKMQARIQSRKQRSVGSQDDNECHPENWPISVSAYKSSIILKEAAVGKVTYPQVRFRD